MAAESNRLSSDPGLSHLSSEDDRNEKQPIADSAGEDKPPTTDFPDGGTRAWAVAVGTAGIAFCTLGYVNSFGLVLAPAVLQILLTTS